MAWQMIDDLNGDVVAPDQARALAITLDGDPLAAYDVTARPVDELLADLGRMLIDGIAARIGPDEPLDPGPLHEPNRTGPDEGYGADSPTPAHAADDEPAVDESVEEQPAPVQPVESPHVSTPSPAPPIAESSDDRPAERQQGEAVRGHATDATVRTWARTWDVPCSTTGALKAWVRAEYERLAGAPPDFRARRIAREVGGAELTVPTMNPAVATHDTVNVWLARNGLEDRLPPTDAGRAAYRAAWDNRPQPAPPAAPPAAAAGQDTAGPDTSAADWSSARRDPAVANGHPLPTQAPPSVRPAVEPVGDELASEGKTPRQIMAATGVWLREARAAVRKAAQR